MTLTSGLSAASCLEHISYIYRGRKNPKFGMWIHLVTLTSGLNCVLSMFFGGQILSCEFTLELSVCIPTNFFPQ